MAEWIAELRSRIGSRLTFVTSAGIWIEDASGRVLLQRRDRSEEVWGFPGGVMELGEAAHETAVREAKEETGLDVEISGLVGVYTKYFETLQNGDQCQCVTFMFRGKPVGGSLKLDFVETFELRYFPPSDMPRLHTPQHRQIADDVRAGGGTFFR